MRPTGIEVQFILSSEMKKYIDLKNKHYSFKRRLQYIENEKSTQEFHCKFQIKLVVLFISQQDKPQ